MFLRHHPRAILMAKFVHLAVRIVSLRPKVAHGREEDSRKSLRTSKINTKYSIDKIRNGQLSPKSLAPFSFPRYGL